MKILDIQKQKAEWKRKGWSIPELRGGKQDWFALVVELICLIEKSSIADLSLSPMLSSTDNAYPWRVYAPFLKGVGLVCNKSGVLSLSEIGLEFNNSPSHRYLANLLHDRYRLFGETLELLESCSKTVEEVDKELCREYCLDWANLSNTRRRMDWLEVLELIQNVGNRKWGLTQEGKELLQEWPLITPDVIDTTIMESEDISISAPPFEIYELLLALKENVSLQKKRNTYNIWAPSPNRIENIRTIVQFSFERVSRTDLFKFIEEEFNLKTSSVESMMPFLKADGLIEEVGRNIYVATSEAKAWCDSGNDLDFIRILHSHKRFVGEMIVAAENVVTRNEIYIEAKKYGYNTEKARWIMGFLLEAGLLEETQYLHVKATPLGMKLSEELPLMGSEFAEQNYDDVEDVRDNIKDHSDIALVPSNALFDALCVSAKDPTAEGKASGVAFEENIASVFRFMGFDANRIGGSGNTDVVVRWKEDDGKTITAIVDGKSKSSGTVTHSDISDVAIETHKEKNNAEYVAIVGPGFCGDTIKEHARKKGFALITDSELINIALQAQVLGLSLTEVSLLFKVPNGLSQLNELIVTRKREMEIITLVIATFKQEQDAMDSLSARDLYFLLRRTSISPSLEELITTFELLAKEEIGVLTQIKKASSTEHTPFAICKQTQSVNRLRALATAIENGLY